MPRLQVIAEKHDSVQIFVIGSFLILGTLLVIYATSKGIAIPEKTDDLFGIIAAHPSMPIIVGILFIIGLISAAYSAAGSALTSLTTSFTIDILDGQKRYENDEKGLARLRKRIHLLMSVLMAVVIIAFYHISSSDAISAVFTVASYTYGPILGLFAYGMFTKSSVNDRWVWAVCLFSPILSWGIQWGLKHYAAYEVGFELLLLNALITIVGLRITNLLPTKDRHV